jgi:hypothetical protein
MASEPPVTQDDVDALLEATNLIDAQAAEIERLRDVLKTTLGFAIAYAEGTGTLFDDAMELARAELANLQEPT